LRDNTQVALFIDVNNLFHGGQRRFKGHLDYRLLFDHVRGEFGELVKSVAYGSKDNDFFKPSLKDLGAELRWSHTRINWNVCLTLDVVRQIERVDVIVIASCDPQIAPIHGYVKHEGLKSVALGFNINESIKAEASEWHEIRRELMLNAGAAKS
jgi:uncharacterized LabA/DUF88 family protein